MESEDIWQGSHIFTKVELKYCKLTEIEMVLKVIAQKEHEIGVKFGWWAREENDTFVRYHFLQHGAGDRISCMQHGLKKYPTYPDGKITFAHAE